MSPTHVSTGTCDLFERLMRSEAMFNLLFWGIKEDIG